MSATLLAGLWPSHAASPQPAFQWAVRAGGSGWDAGNAIAPDGQGNVYVAGAYAGYNAGSATFGSGANAVTLTCTDFMDGFLAKYTASGTLAWVRQLTPSDVPSARAIALDAEGNVLVNGRGAGQSMYIWRYDPNGNLLQTTTLPVYEGQVTVDAANNICLTGNFEGTRDFDPGPGQYLMSSVGHSDVYVLKLDPLGNFLWARSMGGSGLEMGLGIAVDSAGNAFVSGVKDAAGVYGSTTLPSAGSRDGFVAKVDGQGNILWARNIGGSGYDYVGNLAVDAAGNVYVPGAFNGQVDFDPGPAAQYLTSAGAFDGFVLKLDSSGNFVWVRQLAGSGDNGAEHIGVDGDGNTYFCGVFQGTVDFDPGPATSALSGFGGGDVFLEKLDSNGNFEWAVQLGGPDIDADYALALDELGNVYAAGYFAGTSDFDPSASTFYLTSAGVGLEGADMWLLKLGGEVPDTEPPTIACPPNVTVSTDTGQCHAMGVTLGSPSVSDNRGVAEVRNDAPAQFPKGTTTVTWTAVDTSGNTAQCTQTVTVEDKEKPALACPQNITVGCSAQALVPVTYTASATDNCDPSPTVEFSPASDSGFPVGSTTVTVTARDASGNASTCTFTVTRAPLGFAGFLPPIDGGDATGGSFASPKRTFKMNSTIPVKFTASCDGAAVLSGVHRLQATKYTDATTGGDPIDATPQDAATTGNQFRLVDSQWHFNLDTKATGMSAGIWQLVAILADGTQHYVWIQIK